MGGANIDGETFRAGWSVDAGATGSGGGARAPDEAGRELVKDLCVQRGFRRDVFVRGLRRVPRDPAVNALWVAAAAHGQGEVTLAAQAGLAKLPQPLIDAVRAALQDGPQTIAALRRCRGAAMSRRRN